MESPKSSKKKGRVFLVVGLIVIVLAAGAVAGFTLLGGNSSDSVLPYELREPLGDITTAKLDINVGDGDLTIDGLTGGEPMLATGTLQYLEGLNPPERTLESFNGQATLTLVTDSRGQTGFRLPWEACNGLVDWNIQLNPTVAYDITVDSEGGIVNIDLEGMSVTRLMAETGGGSMEVVLPATANNLNVTAKTGAGKVVVYVPSGIAARIKATTGMGKVNVAPSFAPINDDTYQSPDFDSAAQKVEITVSSGAGEVNVVVK